MPQMDEMIDSSASMTSVPQPEVVMSSTQPSTQSSVNAFINCENSAPLMVYNQNENQLLSINNMISAQNDYKPSVSGLSSAQTQLTFSDLTPPVPNVSTLESDRLLTVDTSLPTVDGVSGAVPESKSLLIQQMPSIEISSTEQLMAPKDGPSLVEVSKSQYSNIFEPVINGPSGSAPQTPDASPLASIDPNVNCPNSSISSLASNSESTELQSMATFNANSATFGTSGVSNDVFNVQINQMVPVLTSPNVSAVTADGPLPVLGVAPAIQEQLLDAIPPPSSNFPPGPPPTDESGIPTALPGEFPLSLLPVEEEKIGELGSASVPLDKIEATINMNANPVSTLTNAVSVPQSDVNLIKSLPQTPQLIPSSQTSELMATNQMEVSAQEQFNLNYNCQSNANELVLSVVTPVEQLGAQTQTSTPTQLPQPSQQQQQSQQSMVTLPEAQLPPPPAPPSASLAVFQSSQNELISEMVHQSHLTAGLPPPPPLQPVQSVSQSNIAPLQEINTLTNLVPVVETSTQMTGCGPMTVVVKTEPQTYNESMTDSNDNIMLPKLNDDNNNPILSNSLRPDKEIINRNCLPTSTVFTNNAVRGFPLCVISSTPTTFMSKNTNSTIAPKYELTLPPKKAKFGTGLVTVTQSLSSKINSQSVPSTGMIYDLPQDSESSSATSPPFRLQSGLQQTSKITHNMSPPFTTVSPILFSGLVPSVSVAIDGPLSLVKEDKVRQLMASTSISNHPDYPAISGLLSFIKPDFTYHSKTLTTSSLSPSSEVVSEIPLSLSIKNSMSQTPITSIAMNQLSSGHSGHVPSLSRPSLHQSQQQSITSATTLLHTPPTAVPVSVVTSVVDHHRGLSQKIKNFGQNGNRNKINEEHNTSGSLSTGSKLQLAPLLSGDPAKPFQCALCGKHLASKNVYQLHLRSHSGEKPFSCNICGHSFSQKTSLTRHMRSHTGERPFPCQVCGKRFADKERIKIHMRTHTGEKPFSCDICGKQFSQKSTVKRHMSVHTGEKPFKCETCGKGFANRGNLTAHTKTHSNS